MLLLSGKADGHRFDRLTAADGVRIPYRKWQRPGAGAVVLYLHGQGGHSGPFTHMGDRLHELGLNVYAWDHRGHGLSREPRGDIHSYEYFIDDTMDMIRLARRQNPGVPVFLLGHSMGGHIALRAAFRAGKKVAGLVLLSPGFKLKDSPPLSYVVKVALMAVFQPDRTLPGVENSAVTTRNQVHLERCGQDEHWVTDYTVRFLLRTVLSLRKARREAAGLSIPVLVMQAGEDHLVCGEESRRFFDLIPFQDKEFRLLAGVYHNLVVEPEMPEIAQEIADWIRKRV